jgi:hypothetical protein
MSSSAPVRYVTRLLTSRTGVKFFGGRESILMPESIIVIEPSAFSVCAFFISYFFAPRYFSVTSLPLLFSAGFL